MEYPSRRQVLTAGVTAVAASAGCLSVGGDTTVEVGTPEFGTIANSATPDGDQPLPAPVAGDPAADVTVAVYEDYACPHCATFSDEVFTQLASEYLEDGLVRYEFHDYPIPVDETVSWQAASAARAVQAMAGNQAYFEYSEQLFRNQSGLDPEAYETLTEGLDVDGAAVREAATAEEYETTVSADKQAGSDRGVDGTPTVFVDGDEIEDRSFESIRDAIESARSG